MDTRTRQPVLAVFRLPRLLFVLLLLVPPFSQAGRLAGQERQTVVGTITDEMCANANHTAMKMGDSDAECAKACVTYHSAAYVLYDGTTTYQLSDQKAAEALAGKKVRVVGAVDAKTRKITVDSMRAEP